MSDEPWFLGQVNRQKAEEVLYSAVSNGSFVIRSSESISGAYALMVLYNKSIHTYRILPTENRLLAVQTVKGVQQRKFSTLKELVREYRSPQNGLICGLAYPVGLNNNAAPNVSNDLVNFQRHDPLPSIPLPNVPSSLPAILSNVSSTSTAKIFQTLGVKVMPNAPVLQPPANTPSTEKLRDLPPVPNRDHRFPIPSSSRPASNATEDSGEKDIRERLLERVKDFRTSWPHVDSDFFDNIHLYASEDGLASDLTNVRKGCGQCANLQSLLAREAVAFQSELENFLLKVDVLRQLFDFNSAPRRSNSYNRVTDSDVDLDTFLGRLADCQTVVKSLNSRACINLQEHLGIGGAATLRTQPKRKTRIIEPLLEKTFDVKQEGALKLSKQKLKLDIAKGKLFIIKGEEAIEHDSSKVLQLIKNKKSKSKLSIVFDGNKKRDFTFEQGKHREAFCQLMQFIRNKHSMLNEPDCVSIFCGSWNMGDAMPPADISSWFLCSGQGRSLDPSMQSIPHDIYVVGTQETGMPEKDWMAKILETLQDITGAAFHVVAMDALWHIKILVIVKEDHKNRISHVQTSSVKTGIANALGNKGAVAVSFQFGGTSFCFINVHLTSGNEKCVRRNQNYQGIMRSLNLGENSLKIFDLTNRFDHLYFFGDLNYRLEMDDVQDILSLIKKRELATLLNTDQLRREKDLKKVFCGFNEDEILFPPTYRYERGTRATYSYLKVKKTGVRINVPSWCDRVLWKSYPETHNVCHAYGCSEDIMTSDHSPLFSNFQVGVRGQYVSNEDSVKSGRGMKVEAPDTTLARLSWTSDTSPVLKPMISDREYLIDQHLLICVCSEDDGEVHGECVIALRSKVDDTTQSFEEKLTRRGEEVGLMRGKLLVIARDSKAAPKEKTYDFIRRGDDDTSSKRDVVEEAYSDISEIKPAPSTQKQVTATIDKARKELNKDISLRLKLNVVDEGEYADPAFGGFDPKPAPGQWIPSPCNSRKASPDLTPPILAGNVASLDFQRSTSITADKPTPAARALPNPKANHPVFLPPHRSTSSPLPPTPIPLSPKRTPPIEAQQWGDRLADFQNAERDLSTTTAASALTPPASPVAVTYFQPTPNPRITSNPSPTNIYQIPSNLPMNINSTTDPMNARAFSSSAPIFPMHIIDHQASISKRRSVEEHVPLSVEEFLSSMDLRQYTAAFQNHGWDCIEFLGEMTEDDLNDMGITDSEHCRTILRHVQDLPPV